MSKKIVSAISSILIIVSVLALAFRIQPGRAFDIDQTIFINADGSIYPPTAPISSADNITYTLTDNINETSDTPGIWIKRNGTTLNGAGYTLQGIANYGIYVENGSNVAIMNLNITGFNYGLGFLWSLNCSASGNNIVANSIYGILLWNSSGNMISGNNLTRNAAEGIRLDSTSNYNIIHGNNITANINMTANIGTGIEFYHSSYNRVSENNIADNKVNGISLSTSDSNVIVGNSVANNEQGIVISESSNNNVTGNGVTNTGPGIGLFESNYTRIFGNNITNNGAGIVAFSKCSSNSIYGNNITGNGVGTQFILSGSNSIYHNSFINNEEQARTEGVVNVWDDGYPSGGNYWSNYTGIDLYNGPYQSVIGSDGIGDTQHVTDANNTDRYPLMGSFGGSTGTGTNVTVFPAPDLCFIFEEVTTEGSTTATATTAPPPPPGMTLISTCYEISVTAVYEGRITIRMTYDLDGMTQSLHATGTTRHHRSTLVLLQYGVLATDVNKDGKVDLRDVCKVLAALGSSPGSRRWNPACDVNNDGVVNCKDLLLVLKDLGKPSPTWTDITKFVDIANHVVYGETDHFSAIGIHGRE